MCCAYQHGVHTEHTPYITPALQRFSLPKKSAGICRALLGKKTAVEWPRVNCILLQLQCLAVIAVYYCVESRNPAAYLATGHSRRSWRSAGFVCGCLGLALVIPQQALAYCFVAAAWLA